MLGDAGPVLFGCQLALSAGALNSYGHVSGRCILPLGRRPNVVARERMARPESAGPNAVGVVRQNGYSRAKVLAALMRAAIRSAAAASSSKSRLKSELV
jgi:hypothetical protein